MRRLASLLLVALLAGTLIQVALPAQAAAPLMTYDASGTKATRVTISCFVDYGPWSTWRSDNLPVVGSWVYKSSGSPGLYPDYDGLVQCTARAFDKRGKIVAYSGMWQFVVGAP